MSGQPELWDLPPHRTGTTWAPYLIQWAPDGVVADLSGARAHLVAKDGMGVTIVDYDTASDEPAKPGIEFHEDTENGTGWWLWIVGDLQHDGVLVLPPGILAYDLKLWLDDEITVDLYGSWPILAGQTP
jgi:hypothetical protein